MKKIVLVSLILLVLPLIALFLFLFSFSPVSKVFAVDGATITTIAGQVFLGGFGGDGGPATQAYLQQPSDVALLSDGSIVFTDTENQRVRKIDINGVITTIAGTGEIGFSGDGGLATLATFNTLWGIAVDGFDNIYVVDHHNNRIRKIDTNGAISTIAGVGLNYPGYPGTCTYDLVHFEPGDGRPATEACLHNPTKITFDKEGNLLISETGARVIRKVDMTTGIISRIAGTPYTWGFSGDGGPALQATFFDPLGIKVDFQGNILIVDATNYRVRRITADGIITTIAGTGVSEFSSDGTLAISATLQRPGYLALDILGNIYFTEYDLLFNGRIRKIDASGILTTVAGGGDQFTDTPTPATSAGLATPAGLSLSGLDKLYIAEFGSHRIRLVTIQPPVLIEDLVKEVESFNLKQGIENSLDVKLQNASDSLTAENAGLREDAINKFNAFIQAVEAQRGKELTDLQATILVSAANEIIASFSE